MKYLKFVAQKWCYTPDIPKTTIVPYIVIHRCIDHDLTVVYCFKEQFDHYLIKN